MKARWAMVEVRETRTFTSQPYGLTVVKGQVSLPASGWWSADPTADHDAVNEKFASGEVKP